MIYLLSAGVASICDSDVIPDHFANPCKPEKLKWACIRKYVQNWSETEISHSPIHL